MASYSEKSITPFNSGEEDVKEIYIWQGPSKTGFGITGLQLVYIDGTNQQKKKETRIYGQRLGIKRKHCFNGSITNFIITSDDDDFVRRVSFTDGDGVFQAGAESKKAGWPRAVDVGSGKLKGIQGRAGDAIYELEPIFEQPVVEQPVVEQPIVGKPFFERKYGKVSHF